MKHILLISILIVAAAGCQQKKKDVLTENLKISDLRDTTTFVTENKDVINVQMVKPTKKQLKASAIIEEFKYIPIETSDSSLMGQYQNAYIYDNRIYIQDVETRMGNIFDMNGKFINKIGKKGNGPGELIHLTSMTIDPFGNHLIAYDQFFDKLFYYTLDGHFLHTKQMPLRSDQNIRFIAPNRIAFAVNQTKENTQLNELEQCNIIYTDSALNILGGTFRTEKNFAPNYSPPSFSSNRGNVAYTPTYTPDFYEFVNDTLVHRYHFNYDGFDNPFRMDKAETMADNDSKRQYLFSSTRILPPVLFTDNFLWFKTQTPNVADEFYSYYDKSSGKMISFRPSELDFDTEFRFASVLTTYNDYLVGYMPADYLIKLKENYDNSNRKMAPEIAAMIDNLQSDDNDVLVLFKLKSIQ